MSEANPETEKSSETSSRSTLADVPVGAEARVVGFKQMTEAQRAHLQAFGLALGRWARVLQHSPVTIVMADNTELALENEIARRVVVEGVKRWHGGPFMGRRRGMRGARRHWRRHGRLGKRKRNPRNRSGSNS
ncbi:MAG: ferrous iron transport protein A [Anaerolineales bacterium]